MGIPSGGGGVKAGATTRLDTKVGGKIWPDGNPQMATFELGAKPGGGDVAGSGSARVQSTPEFRFRATNQASGRGRGSRQVPLSELLAFSRAKGGAKVRDDCAPSTPPPPPSPPAEPESARSLFPTFTAHKPLPVPPEEQQSLRSSFPTSTVSPASPLLPEEHQPLHANFPTFTTPPPPPVAPEEQQSVRSSFATFAAAAAGPPPPVTLAEQESLRSSFSTFTIGSNGSIPASTFPAGSTPVVGIGSKSRPPTDSNSAAAYSAFRTGLGFRPVTPAAPQFVFSATKGAKQTNIVSDAEQKIDSSIGPKLRDLHIDKDRVELQTALHGVLPKLKTLEINQGMAELKPVLPKLEKLHINEDRVDLPSGFNASSGRFPFVFGLASSSSSAAATSVGRPGVPMAMGRSTSSPPPATPAEPTTGRPEVLPTVTERQPYMPATAAPTFPTMARPVLPPEGIEKQASWMTPTTIAKPAMPTMVGPGAGTEGQVSMSQTVTQALPINVTLGSAQTGLESQVSAAAPATATAAAPTVVRSGVPLTGMGGQASMQATAGLAFPTTDGPGVLPKPQGSVTSAPPTEGLAGMEGQTLKTPAMSSSNPSYFFRFFANEPEDKTPVFRQGFVGGTAPQTVPTTVRSTCTDGQTSKTPPVSYPNPSPSFTFSANGTEGRTTVLKSRKDKVQHRPLRPGHRPPLKAKKSSTAEKLASTPSPDKGEVPMDYSPQDTSQAETSSSHSNLPVSGEKEENSTTLNEDDEDSRTVNCKGPLEDFPMSLEKLRAAAGELNLGGRPDAVPEPLSSSFAKQKEHNSWQDCDKHSEKLPTTSGTPLGDSYSQDIKGKEQEEQETEWADDPVGANELSEEDKRNPQGSSSTSFSSSPRVESDGNAFQGPFAFSASPTGGSSSLPRRRARKVHRERIAGRFVQTSTAKFAVLSVQSVPEASNFARFSGNRYDPLSGALPIGDFGQLGFGEGMNASRGVGAVDAEQLCERWRLRGNQAYAKGDFVKAEEFYSLGAGSVSPHETSKSAVRASMLCYSNRAATRMVVGRMREALADCMHAMAVDPHFFRVHLRAANCHLALGETEAAAAAFKECMRQAKESNPLDVKILTDAAEGLKKAQQVEEYTKQVLKLLQNNTTSDTNAALRLLSEALLSSPQSEWLLELKAYALISVQRYNEAEQLCEQTLPLAECNHASVEEKGVPAKMIGPLGWRRRLTAKARFHLGKLEESLEILLQLQEGPAPVVCNEPQIPGALSAEMVVPSIAVIRDLLRHKAEGNRAFQAGKHAEALEHYTAALARNGESRPFCAVCLCNRAAASQALGHIADAIADCSRAIALDPQYAKAISRRAALYEKVRDYGQSCHDVRRLINLYDKQVQITQKTNSQQGKSSPSPSTGPGFSIEEVQQAKERLTKAEEEMKKGNPLDHYSILGLEMGCSANEVKKAYRKAALRHHPDKAGQFLQRSVDGAEDTGLWKDATDDQLRRDGERLIDEVRRDAEQLFKLIGESYAVLSDPSKRQRYDTEEELRKLRTRTSDLVRNVFGNERKHSRTDDGTSVGQSKGSWGSSSPGESGNQSRAGRQRERWDGYSYQYQRWHPGPDAAQPDVYARRGRPMGSYSGSSSRHSSRWEDYQWDNV